MIPYNGAIWTKSVDDVVAFWVETNGLEVEPITEEIAPHSDTNASSSLVRIRYGSADSDAVVEHIQVDGGGHEWLGQENLAGQANLDLNANEEIWAFLSQFSLDDLGGS